ncbi:antitoxin Xre/MbcA/ParS toxin-binding domain-containing protein [Paraflavitalea speifideaquila]|uniref:antitoxin Xre/MbcA/ParS toxin-binding domain-containing protein n=1 Tax=Paraflavitalea speifideaquila TaxID=3076558 RepID=UPI0028E7DD22|nr:antitoxin Xre/MbcA/ParS toxin-binding domain-containing protein [Paraflavitalea speifideiaquila]
MRVALLKEVPGQINDSEILDFLYTKEVNYKHINAIKDLTAFTDDTISDWLNVSVRTFREYRKPKSTFKENVKEHVLLLLSLIKHGKEVFVSPKAFDTWLDTPNFYFDNKTPSTFLNTITGIKFVDDRLTAMEFGDNI